MGFIKYEKSKSGNALYAYNVENRWDPKKKQSRQLKKEYLGVVVDKEKGIFKKMRREAEKLILDFGDSYLLHQFLKTDGFIQIIRKIFANKTEFLLSLLTYRLCYPSAMMYSKLWFEGNYARILYKNVNLSSQRISDFFKIAGDEALQREFFRDYIKSLSNAKKGIIMDTTSLPNQIHMPFTTWGRSGEEIDKQIRFLLVVDKESSEPLFFRYLPGNIVDVSTLKNTIAELEKFGVKENYVCLDAGFYSKDNIVELYENNLQFLTRMPAVLCIYKDLIKSEAKGLESISHAVRYGTRALLIKQKEIDLYGHKAYAHIVLDPRRKGKEVQKLILQAIDEKSSNDDLEYALMKAGIMILVSSFEIKKEDVVNTYYIRQIAEMLFGFSKDDLKILPLRIHTEETLRGFLFMQFLALIAFIRLKKAIGKDYTVEEILLTMRNLKCKVYDSDVLVSELTKQQKIILEDLKIIVPKSPGI